MVSHPQWRNPPVQEVVFELRFSPVEDYSIFAGGMAERQKEMFPNWEKLPVSDWPSNLGLSGLVRHQFISTDKHWVLQTGQDVLSINALAYAGFSDFLKKVDSILSVANQYIDFQSIQRLGLKYINRFDDVSDPFATLNINRTFPDFDLKTTARFQTNCITQKKENTYLSVNVDFPVSNSSLVLALDAFQGEFSEQQEEVSLQDLMNWAEESHDIIWEKFVSLVSIEERKERE